MNEPTIRVEIDNEAGLTYVQLSSSNVAKTEEFTPEINVDLDSFGMVVGVESLSTAADFDVTTITRLAERYHVPSEVVDLFPAAIQVIRDFTQQSSVVAIAAPEYGVLRSSDRHRLTPCP